MRNIFIFLLCLIGIGGRAAVYYVNENGTLPSGVTTGKVFTTLQKAHDYSILAAGDIVYVMNGTYTPQYTDAPVLEITKSGSSSGGYITFQNYPGHSPLVSFNSWEGIKISGASYIIIQGLRVQGARLNTTLINAQQQPMPSKKDANGVPLSPLQADIPRYSNCDNSHSGIGELGLYNGTGISIIGPYLTWSPSYVTTIPHHIKIIGCEVFDCTSSGIAAQNADYITVSQNKVYKNCWYTLFGTSAINFYQPLNVDGTSTVHNLIERNLVYDNKILVNPISSSCIKYDGNGIILDDFYSQQCFNFKSRPGATCVNPSLNTNTALSYTASTIVRNNIVAYNGGNGIQAYLSSKIYIYNNTCYFNGNNPNPGATFGQIKIVSCSNMGTQGNLLIRDPLNPASLTVVGYSKSITDYSPTTYTFNSTDPTSYHPFRFLEKKPQFTELLQAFMIPTDDYLGNPRNNLGSSNLDYDEGYVGSYTYIKDIRTGVDIGAYTGTTYCGTNLDNTILVKKDLSNVVASSDVLTNETVVMRATNSIVLKPSVTGTGGFVAKHGSEFVAQIGNCSLNNVSYRKGDDEDNLPYAAIKSPESEYMLYKIFPNPITSGNLNFGRTVNNYTLMNSTGVVMQQGANSEKLDVTGLSKGMYMLKLDDKIEKVIVE